MKIISFEGIEGVGKSTQISLLKEYLESKKYLVEIYREPGSTITGEKIRDILLNNSSQLSDKAELLLMFAARAELINQKINKSKADFILFDRFYDASIAYQGYGRNLSKTFINELTLFIECPEPNLSFLLDISVEEGFSRKTNDTKDRIESAGIEFFNNVRNGYLEIAKDKRFVTIDASNNIQFIHKSIIKNIESLT
ncbi:MAG: dTMP kinase [SAR86 cluster bacterium]|jgi:dTMP kinase|uniref:Thymidylate kinase n=1 Tax=SAR86 cluster bacterium TaxID=2030880 RepID=A0A520MU95_9GAMM|nr:MAG: dTMP kinase [SAR86 cluster bacterium]